MLEKTFIVLSAEAYRYIEREGLESGDVFDYPAAELDDIVSGAVGWEEQSLYARFVDSDGEVRYGELTRVTIDRFDCTYSVTKVPKEGAPSVVKLEGLGLGGSIEKAYGLFREFPGLARVELVASYPDGTAKTVLTLE